MKGTLQDFSVAENRGWIAADDGNRYSFQGPEWKGTGLPMSGNRVDFELLGDAAIAVTPELAASVPAAPSPSQAQAQPQQSAGGYAPPVAGTSKPDKTTVGICAILLGSIGIHKFLLGFQTEGIIMLAVTLGAGMFTCGASSIVMGVIGLIEGIIYLTMSDQDFDRTYIEGKKKWF
ncbi:TM2 domain-containing protein [Roseimicrobium sp. ORNL1]|uniref:TM2 domain-containing protein n=1 Tax=Roseimicrobium sp. ORNL1 TaxID=2711231 RepID=UPI00197DF2C4|nr:TM2 domain-containing protein [Roseimicrobium sp. ORNL1]